MSAIRSHWFRNLMCNEMLPRRLECMPCEGGFFWTDFDREWRRTGEGIATLVTQTRTIYIFCLGLDLTGDPRYREAIQRGLDFLLDKFCDDEYSGFFSACDRHGAPVNMEKDCYGHAFVILALKCAYL